MGGAATARPRRVRAARRVRTVGRHRVTDERGPTGSGNGPAERGAWRMGQPEKERSRPSPDEQ
jgi:hypothetical protein